MKAGLSSLKADTLEIKGGVSLLNRLCIISLFEIGTFKQQIYITITTNYFSCLSILLAYEIKVCISQILGVK